MISLNQSDILRDSKDKVVCLHNRKFTNSRLIQELTSYKLVRHLQTIVHDGPSEDPITITSRTARRLGFRYSEVKKNVFIDGHERPDVVQDRNAFVQTLETLAEYLVEFDEDGTIKDKVYPPGCEVYGSESRPVILITHDEATFSANDGIRRAWMEMDGEATYLRPKTKGQGIMVSGCFLSGINWAFC